MRCAALRFTPSSNQQPNLQETKYLAAHNRAAQYSHDVKERRCVLPDASQHPPYLAHAILNGLNMADIGKHPEEHTLHTLHHEYSTAHLWTLPYVAFI